MLPWTKQIELRAWPIGQGLFTQADIKVGDARFQVVYDCGAQRWGNGDVWRFPEMPQGRPIDLLVISHFHWDHTAGLADLLERAGGAQRTWIPYTAPKVRALFTLHTAAHGAFGDIPAQAYRDTLDFAINPRTWLEAHGAGLVEEIGQSGRPDGDPPSLSTFEHFPHPPDDTEKRGLEGPGNL